jgi:hypothetical protein
MRLNTANVIYGGIAGALVGAGFTYARAWWYGDASAVNAGDLVVYAACGAVAGIAAFALRGSTGDDGK